jgi:acetoin utilization deacetylase AcuC-like enzyme
MVGLQSGLYHTIKGVMPRTAYVTHTDYKIHNAPGAHPEHAGRIQAVWDVFEESGILPDLQHTSSVPATVEQLARVHHPKYIEHVEEAAKVAADEPHRAVLLDPDTYVCPESYHVGRLSAGGVVAAVDAVLSGQADNALAVVRPPGHHATPTRGMGFCLFSNIAVGARHAQTYDGIERVMIVDYDVHHGNGTQDVFYDDPSVLFISSHQYPFYPGTGAWNEIGEGDSRGTTVNIPLRVGTGSEGFALLYEQVLWPIACRFKPDMILVSAGFDAHWVDPLAGLHLDLDGYAYVTRELIRMADELSSGRIVFVMEGGYDLDALSHGMLNVAYALQGRSTLSDPLGPAELPQQDVSDLVTKLRKLHNLE